MLSKPPTDIGWKYYTIDAEQPMSQDEINGRALAGEELLGVSERRSRAGNRVFTHRMRKPRMRVEYRSATYASGS